MNLFKRNNNKTAKSENPSVLAETALKVIHDGVIIADKEGLIKFINPAAGSMIGQNNAIGLDVGLVIKIESKDGRELSEIENPFIQAVKTSQPLEKYKANLFVAQSDKRVPVSISVLPANDSSQDKIITLRDITKELQEEGEQTEFISTASHEMRTPVATIDGYLSLCLNPQTATIDERARGYLTAAQAASKHLGKLFQDLLDVTKLDDGRARAHFEPVEMIGLVESISRDHEARAKEAKLNYTFGSDSAASFDDSRRLQQLAYGFVDVDYMREILDNLIDNAIKYTPEGGSVYVNVRGDGDRVLINVTDSGIGISADDLSHVFQKFYRSDNSDTRTIGGTGLGLYLVKQRTEAMGGKVWAESAFGEGSTFFVSLPRLTNEEYEKRMIVVRNQKMQEQIAEQAKADASTNPAPAANPVPPTISAPATTPPPQAAPATTPPPQAASAPAPSSSPDSPSHPANTPTAPTSSSASTPPTIVATAPKPQPVQAPPGPTTPPAPPAASPQPVQQINNNLNGEAK